MSNDGINHGRRRILGAMTTVVGGAGAVGVAVPFIGSWNPSARAKAAGAPVKIDIGKVQLGAMVTYEWRGQPVFVLRRTPEILATFEKLTDTLKDPNSEKSDQPGYVDTITRAIKDEYLIMVGICTHLGCSPKLRPEVAPADLGEEWLGGFFCPCHGSKFDLAGRVYNGAPATFNMVIPPHRYVSDSIVIIGEDQGAA